MATLNELLQIMLNQRADSLQLQSDQAPALVIGRELHPLPHPPLPGDALEKFLHQLLDSARYDEMLAEGTITNDYTSEELGHFQFRVRRVREGWVVVFRAVELTSPQSKDPSRTLPPTTQSTPPAAAILRDRSRPQTIPPNATPVRRDDPRTKVATRTIEGVRTPAPRAGSRNTGSYASPTATHDSTSSARSTHPQAVAVSTPPEEQAGVHPTPIPRQVTGSTRLDSIGSSATPAPQPRSGATDPGPRSSSTTTSDTLPRQITATSDSIPKIARPNAKPRGNIPALLEYSVRRGASDLLVSSGANATMRLGGDFVSVKGSVFSDRDILDAFNHLMTDERRECLEASGSMDVAYELHREGGKVQRFRANLFRQLAGLAVAFRPIWDTVPSFEELLLPKDMHTLADFPHGLVLVTGPTGSGKSTTLSALLEHVNRHRAAHIITLEDPIEYVFKRQRSLIHQREIGVHVDTFGNGLRAALRENPDVILVGEMRDLDTITAALSAAETGHLVFSTLHCGSAAQAVERMVNAFPEYQQTQIRTQLAEVLKAVLTQRLLPSIDGKTRVPAVEIARITYALSNLIRERKTHLFTSKLQTARGEGMLAFDHCLEDLVLNRRITRETALRAAHDPGQLEKKIAG